MTPQVQHLMPFDEDTILDIERSCYEGIEAALIRTRKHLARTRDLPGSVRSGMAEEVDHALCHLWQHIQYLEAEQKGRLC